MKHYPPPQILPSKIWGGGYRGRGDVLSFKFHELMLSKFIHFVKERQTDIILLIGVILISLLSFAMGYITAKQQEKKPIQFDFQETRNQPKLYY